MTQGSEPLKDHYIFLTERCNSPAIVYFFLLLQGTITLEIFLTVTEIIIIIVWDVHRII